MSVVPGGRAVGTAYKYYTFYKLVRNGGKWDYKQKYSSVRYRGKKMSGEKFGNYHYGVVGSALGINRRVLLVAAGVAQKRAGTGRKFSFRKSYWDDPRDQRMIRKGMRAYKRGRY
ncbi:polymorphic toxin type 44 domain-containing protein [Priestia megaterium]